MGIRIENQSDNEFNINSAADEKSLFIVLKTRWKLTDYP